MSSDVLEIDVEMPSVLINCPYCKHEDEHGDRIWTKSDGIGSILAEGITFCDKCEKEFKVRLKL